MPLMFEWFQHIGLLAIDLALYDSGEAGIRSLPASYEGVVRGLLNRCSRLMLSILKVGKGGRGGETIPILIRSIGESAILLQWLCSEDPDRLKQYIAEGLRTDLHLRRLINRNIEDRGGEPQEIEARMLRSMDRCLMVAGLTIEEVEATPRMPSLEQMCRDLEYEDDAYIAVQRMGSHAVHGTWTDLLIHYIEEEDGGFRIRDSDESVPEYAHLLGPAVFVLDALEAAAATLIGDEALLDGFIEGVSLRRRAVLDLNTTAQAQDERESHA